MAKTIIAAGGLVVNDRGEILMIFRRGFWDLPKGKLETGESLESCAIREVEEETGLKNIEISRFIGTTFHEYRDPHLQEEVVKESHWFEMRVNIPQQLIPQTEEDITEIKWIPRAGLEAYLNRSYQTIATIVHQYLSKR